MPTNNESWPVVKEKVFKVFAIYKPIQEAHGAQRSTKKSGILVFRKVKYENKRPTGLDAHLTS